MIHHHNFLAKQKYNLFEHSEDDCTLQTGKNYRERMIFSPKSISKVGKGGGKRKEEWGLWFTGLNIFLTL